MGSAQPDGSFRHDPHPIHRYTFCCDWRNEELRWIEILAASAHQQKFTIGGNHLAPALTTKIVGNFLANARRRFRRIFGYFHPVQGVGFGRKRMAKTNSVTLKPLTTTARWLLDFTNFTDCTNVHKTHPFILSKRFVVGECKKWTR